MAILLTLHTEIVARGVWCLNCHLHSATTTRFWTLCELGVFPAKQQTRCARCKAVS